MVDINEYRELVKKRTCDVKELSEIIGVSEAKARRLTHIDGFPIICIGRNRRIILSKLDDWLETNIGECL
ncbi:helix-turn-helix domain-containing protein [Clostridium botulinum]|uniref:Helix-turn-helix domain-containing protein n=1 Tax=Clostridium botulinum TaxID=1491 RepID=A0A846JUT2_CLOBO|nr:MULTISPECIES: helix-turn-helix domain-containing protein [Clostridium]KAI3346582.1 helix-turn-helix domain-containing protein [Clostridium botulinum]KOM86596.1 excisionase [Clostridium botulinum]KOR55759.1 excisionase [Clostridium botulinum]MBN1042909.1 DNA-binding protein [Clostridium botulinum]MCS6111353.1 DNA-binding protein [Clostridium botulinum]